jgi:hypothetical protein
VEKFGQELKADQRFIDIVDELKALHIKKGHDYGTNDDHFANVRASEEFGLPAYLGVLIRMNDKMQRMKQFARKGGLANESFEDSLYDMASYAIIALILYREEKDK